MYCSDIVKDIIGMVW